MTTVKLLNLTAGSARLSRARAISHGTVDNHASILIGQEMARTGGCECPRAVALALGFLQSRIQVIFGAITLASEPELQAMSEFVCRCRHTRDTFPERELLGQEEMERSVIL